MEISKRGLFGLVFVLLLLILPLTFLAGEENSKLTLDKLLNSKDEINTYLQENEVLIPKGVDLIVNDGNILVNISMNDSSLELFYIIIEEKRIVDVEEGIPEKMNYEIKTDEQTITEITESDNIDEKIIEFYDDGRITLKAYGFGNKIKLFFGKIFFKIFG